MKSITFDTLVEKVAELEKSFGNKLAHPTRDTILCLPQKGKNQSHDSSSGEDNKRGRGIKTFKGRGVGTIEVIYLIFTVTIAERMVHMKQIHA
jgi:hypothetical protein